MELDILNGKIRVLNYEQSPVGFPSQHNQQGVFIRGRDEDEEFVIERVAFVDIEIENSKSDLFKVGRLRFHPDEEEAVYLKLGIEDKENIMNDKQLFDLLMTDSIETVKKISSMKSLSLLTRMKSKLFFMERAGKIPPHKIAAVVNERLNELKNGGKRNPNSQINKILEQEQKLNEDNRLKDTLEELVKKVQYLEKEIEQKDQLVVKSQSAIESLLAKVESITSEQQTDNKQDKRQKQTNRTPETKK